MKPKSVFLDELTNRELEQFLQGEEDKMVLVPVGATEQHGPHGPMGTDVFLPKEVARRVAMARKDILVAPAIAYGLSYPHEGFVGEFSLKIETYMAVIRDLAISFGKAGFRRVVFLNGHFDNTYALAYACAQAAKELPKSVRAFPLNHWDGYRPDQMQEFGMHAGIGETSMVMAINPDLVDLEKLNVEHPAFPQTKTNSSALHTAFFFSSPGSVYRITKSGTWGDARGSSAEKGEKFLQWGAETVMELLDDMEKMFTETEIR